LSRHRCAHARCRDVLLESAAGSVAAAAQQPTYDGKTGKLTQLIFDRNRNGVMDTWTEMDGSRPIRSRIDQDEDGKIDRWEYYDDQGKILKVGFSRANDGKPDAWSFPGADRHDRPRRDLLDGRREGDRSLGVLHGEPGSCASNRNTTGDGRVDMWETYEAGALKTAAYDENGDGRPDRRLTYNDGQLALIESEPDASGPLHEADRLPQ